MSPTANLLTATMPDSPQDIVQAIVSPGLGARSLGSQRESVEASAVSPSSVPATGSHLMGERAVAESLGMPFVDLADVRPNPELLAKFPARVLFRDSVLPLEQIADDCVRVAISDPYNLEGISELSALSGFELDTVMAESRQIVARLHETLGVAGGTVSDLVNRIDHHTRPESGDQVAEDEGSEASVVRLVNELLTEALTQGASDVHLEPSELGLAVRYRVDGQLRLQPMPPELHRFRSAIVSRLKIMAKLNIAEKRLPQDGRIKLVIAGREIDVRVSVIPMLHGEGVVMRLLDQSRTAIDLEQMQIPMSVLEPWKRLIRRPHGMVLVTGPTGSGKTTTLYASLASIRDSSSKIITIEDPVEYHLDGISQIQVHNKIGFTFAAGLRSVLRHDPDVVLIGEIRDSETAVSAVQAALTGHLVFSTLHTNDAASAFTRLTDMGIEPYLVASTIHAVLAQRLVRRLCHQCRRPISPSEIELPGDLHVPANARLFQPSGCRACHGTGYNGRLAIFELLKSDPIVRKLCIRGADSLEIRRHALASGMIGLRESGWQWVIAGETTMDEVLRAAVDDDAGDVVSIETPTTAS